jgi:hypothetical protein
MPILAAKKMRGTSAGAFPFEIQIKFTICFG